LKTTVKWCKALLTVLFKHSWFVVGCMVVLLIIIAANTKTDRARVEAPTPAEPSSVLPDPPKPALELVDAKSASDEYGRAIVGKVSNNSSKTYSMSRSVLTYMTPKAIGLAQHGRTSTL
jgi:hypothetical protein